MMIMVCQPTAKLHTSSISLQPLGALVHSGQNIKAGSINVGYGMEMGMDLWFIGIKFFFFTCSFSPAISILLND